MDNQTKWYYTSTLLLQTLPNPTIPLHYSTWQRINLTQHHKAIPWLDKTWRDITLPLQFFAWPLPFFTSLYHCKSMLFPCIKILDYARTVQYTSILCLYCTLLYLTLPSLNLSYQNSTLPTLDITLLNHSIPLQHHSFHIFTFQLHHILKRYNTPTPPYMAILYLSGSLLCISKAIDYLTTPLLCKHIDCFTITAQCYAFPTHRNSTHIFTFPLLHSA